MVTQQLMVAIDFHSIFFHMEVNGQLLPTFFKISSFVLNIRKKLIKVWNNLRVSEWWQNFHFWVNYPFNPCISFIYVRAHTVKWSATDVPNAISRPIHTYFTRWLIRTNSYDLTHTILCDLSRPQWRVGLGAGLGVGHSYKFVHVKLVKYVWFGKYLMNLYEWGRTN